MDVHEDEAAEADALRELAKGEYKLDEKQDRLREYIKANLAVTEFANLLSEDFWLREVIKDVDSKNPFVRSRALTMLGQYLNILGKKNSKPEPKAEVDFQ